MHCRWCRCRGCQRLAGACAFFSNAAASSMLPSAPSELSEAELKKLSRTTPPSGQANEPPPAQAAPKLKANGEPEPPRKCLDGDTGKPVYCSEAGARQAPSEATAVAEAAAVAEAEAAAVAAAEAAVAEAVAVDPATPREANAAVVSPLHEAAAGGEAAVMRCVRETFADMHSWYAHIPRKAKDHDCEYMCFNDRKEWCAAYEFAEEGNGTCKMFDDCSAWTPGTSLARRPTGSGEAPAARGEAAAREAAAAWDHEAAAAARGRGDWMRRPARR